MTDEGFLEIRTLYRVTNFGDAERSFRLFGMNQPGPEMQLRCDVNGNPISAKCSACGAQMPQSSTRITNPIDNVAWFQTQFSLHVAQFHPPVEPRKSTFAGPKRNAIG
jgi:hypothetical protein